MGIGDVFARAWDLWRRDVLWLVLAGLVVAVIMVTVLAIVGGIFTALIAGAGTAIGADALDDSAGSLTGLGAGIGVLGILVYLVGLFLVQVLTFTFYGGLFEMVIGAYRQQRNVRFGDLFSGFRKFGSYALYAVVMWAISFGLGLLNLLPVIGAIVAFCVSVWIAIIWLYVLPLIADQGLSFLEAAGRSNRMVKDAGWWWTFGMVVLLGLAAIVLAIVLGLVAWAFFKTNETLGFVIGALLFIVFGVLFPPYAICYVSVLFVGSGGDIVTVPAGGGMGTLPPAPPAPPAYGGQGMGAPPVYSMPPQSPAGADAWRAAADPLAAAPPAPQPPPAAAGASAATPAGSVAAPAAPADAASDPSLAGGRPPEPASPEPPAPAAPTPPPPPGDNA